MLLNMKQHKLLALKESTEENNVVKGPKVDLEEKKQEKGCC